MKNKRIKALLLALCLMTASVCPAEAAGPPAGEEMEATEERGSDHESVYENKNESGETAEAAEASGETSDGEDDDTGTDGGESGSAGDEATVEENGMAGDEATVEENGLAGDETADEESGLADGEAADEDVLSEPGEWEESDDAVIMAAPPGENYVSGSLPDQGMYALICAADPAYAVGTAGNVTAYGTAVVTQPWDRRPTEGWIIRRAEGNYYYIKAGVNNYNGSEPTPTIGWTQGETLALKEGWYAAAKPEDELWELSFDQDGACRFIHKATGKVLDVAGGIPGNGVRLQIHKNNDTSAQRFYLIDLKTHDIAYTVTDRTSTADIGQNRLEISNLNSLKLAQNTMATAQSLVNVRWGSGVTVTAETGFSNKSNWALSSDGQTCLPAYRVVMDAANPGSDEEFVEVTYPEAGRYFDGERTVRVGARVMFSRMLPADVLSQSFDWVSSDPADGHKTLVIGTNLFSGFWYNNITKMDMTVTFFNADTGEDLTMNEAYLTFNSLSNNINPENVALGRDIALPSTDAYGEFVGIRDRAVTGYVSGPLGNAASADSAAVTNIVSMDLEIWPPYANSSLNGGVQSVFIGQARRYPGSAEQKQATWKDALGESNFTRNSVSLPLDNAQSTTFVLGTLKGEAWNSFSSAPIYARVEPPLKRVAAASGDGARHDDTSAVIPLSGGEAVFRVIQKVPQIGFDTAEALASLTVTDQLEDDFDIVDVQLETADQFTGAAADIAREYGVSLAALSRDWTISRQGKTVTFTYTGTYREMLDGGAGTPGDSDKAVVGSFLIRVKPGKTAVSDTAIPNHAVTHWNMTAGSVGEAASNEVTVTPVTSQAQTEIPILNAGGPGSAGVVLTGMSLLFGLAMLAGAGVLRRRRESAS